MLKGLYKLFGLNLSEAQFETLFDKDVRRSIRAAISMAIGPCGRYDLERLKVLYERMKDALIAA